jgi:hypothetical protein
LILTLLRSEYDDGSFARIVENSDFLIQSVARLSHAHASHDLPWLFLFNRHSTTAAPSGNQEKPEQELW